MHAVGGAVSVHLFTCARLQTTPTGVGFLHLRLSCFFFVAFATPI